MCYFCSNMTRYIKRLTLFITALCSIWACNAQVNLGYEPIDSVNGLHIDKYWKFHTGDNMEWANPSFDDRSWDTLSADNSYKNYDRNIKKLEQAGNGWFRIHLKVVPSLFNKTVLLLIQQSGASEIYLDNKLVQHFGKLGNAQTEVPFDPKQSLYFLHLGGDTSQVIAVRLSIHKFWKEKFPDEIFSLNLAPVSSANEVEFNNLNGLGVIIFSIIFGVFLTFSIFHLLLFLYYRKVLSNLYYSLFTFILSLFYLTPFLVYLTPNPLFHSLLYEINHYLVPPCFFLIVLLLYSIFGRKLNWFFWVLAGLTVFTDAALYVKGNNGAFSYSMMIQAISACFSGIFMIIRGIREKKQGVWILATGFFIFLGLMLLVLLYVTIKSFFIHDIDTGFNGGLLVAIILFIWVFSIPASMSVYLAGDFARTNKKLALELVHVKQLGEQNLQKEIEKQEIIKGQKQELETKVREATAEILQQKDELAEKNRDITDSINYAQRIQTAILPDNTLLDQALGEYLVLFRPKDVVSGDFFWCHRINDKVIFAVADCTGHGVPGAFMSMIGISLFNEIVLGKGITDANAILDELRRKLSATLQQNTEHPSNRDGMDVALCVWNKNDNVLQFAGANNRLYLVSKDIAVNGSVQESERVKLSNNHLLEILPDKQPIGYQEDKMDNPFTKSIIQLNKGDTIFISSDGFTDQFGGDKNKKFTSKKFKALLASLTDKSVEEQKATLEQVLENWKKSEIQTDDICVVGVKIT